MTTDEFDAKYKLLKQIAHGTGRSFTAQESGSGRAVLVHFVAVDANPPATAVVELIDRLGPRDRSKILEILAVNQSTVVVTQFLEGFEGFDAWLRSRLAEPPIAAPERSPEPVPQGGEFTRLFEPPAASGSAPPAPAPAAPEGPRGSFTELFRTPPEAKAPPYPVTPPAAPPIEILSVRLPPSEPAPPRPVARVPSWPSSLEPPQAPPLHNPVLPIPQLRPRGGEPIIKAPPRDQLPPPSPLPGWSGESDFTRQLRPAPPPADPAPAIAPPAPTPPPADAGARSLVPLLLVLNIVVVIATGLIVYFALKRC